MARVARRSAPSDSSANLGFEADLWAAADTLRGNIESAEYKHVVLGLIFLKYVSDAFEERYNALVQEAAADPGVDPEDPDEYLARNVFWLPPEARWQALRDKARSPEIGQKIDEAMREIEARNPKLRGVLPRDYSRPALDKARLGQLIDRFSNLGLGGPQHQSKDTLGRVYEYCLNRFASSEGRRGGEYWTPRCVVGLLVDMLQPLTGSGSPRSSYRCRRSFEPLTGLRSRWLSASRPISYSHGRLPPSATPSSPG